MASDPDFLRAVYEQTQAEMRWRSEVEYRLLTIQVSVVAFLVSAQGLVYRQIAEPSAELGALSGTAVFILALAGAMSWKIKSEHAVYEALGGTVVRLWERFSLFEPDSREGEPLLGEGAREYGKGPGYKRTIAILWLLSGGGIVASVLMALFL
jgi:hypothetical protein